MLVIDLTLPLSDAGPPFTDPSGYADPPTAMDTWVRIGERRGAWTSPFHVSRLQLSAHAGPHIDAPSHFHDGAPSLDGLPAGTLVGRAAVVDVRDAANDLSIRLHEAAEHASADDVTPLVLTPPAWLTPDAVDEVIAWQRPLIAFAGGEDPGYDALSRLLGARRWIVTSVDPSRATLVRDGDLLVVAPLAFTTIEAAPCRVFAIRS